MSKPVLAIAAPADAKHAVQLTWRAMSVHSKQCAICLPVVDELRISRVTEAAVRRERAWQDAAGCAEGRALLEEWFATSATVVEMFSRLRTRRPA